VNVTGLQNTFVKQMRFAGQDITHRPMVLTPSGGSLDIIVSKESRGAERVGHEQPRGSDGGRHHQHVAKDAQ